MTDIATADPTKALAGAGETPRVTDVQPDAAAPPPANATGLLDQRGQAFDPALHETDKQGNPTMSADGRWRRKRGNGARKARGESYVVPPPRRAPKPNAAAGDVDQVEPAAGSPAAADGAHIHVPEVMPPGPEPIPEAEYEGTAIGLKNGAFSLMQLWLGPAWKPEADEGDAWTGALRRLWHRYQLPRVGPIVEIIMLVPATIAKRREDARTREGWDRMRAWLGLGRREPAQAPPSEDAHALARRG